MHLSHPDTYPDTADSDADPDVHLSYADAHADADLYLHADADADADEPGPVEPGPVESGTDTEHVFAGRPRADAVGHGAHAAHLG